MGSSIYKYFHPSIVGDEQYVLRKEILKEKTLLNLKIRSNLAQMLFICFSNYSQESFKDAP